MQIHCRISLRWGKLENCFKQEQLKNTMNFILDAYMYSLEVKFVVYFVEFDTVCPSNMRKMTQKIWQA